MGEHVDPRVVPDHSDATFSGAAARPGRDVRAGVDTDGDARPDTLLTTDVDELRIHTDLDGDGFADQVLGIGPDGTVRELSARPVGPVDGAEGGEPLDMLDTWYP